jgi:hypothetical protein
VYSPDASPRAARFIAALPVEVWSPGLERTVRISEQQKRLSVAIAQRHSWRLRELAAATGYANAGTVSRALAQLDRLGFAAHSSSRGRKGSTVAWIRAGAMLGRELAELMRIAFERARALRATRNVSTLSEGIEHPVRRTERVETLRPLIDVFRPPIGPPIELRWGARR